jgi:dihydrofolate synthase/folylpolyglutamate synthase
LATSFRGIDDALAWLGSHVDYERTAPTRRDIPTLEPVALALRALGDPHRDVDYVHVTGTNGKGSTTALAAALLTAEGRRVGTYTSPDLHAVNERITVAGTPIDDAQLTVLLGRLCDVEGTLASTLTRFDLLTVGALLHFADEGVEAGVVEVGLGGTWDSTNVLDARVAVVTNVSLDHTEVLGDTVEAIARDKAGIVKPGAIAVLGDRAASTIELQGAIARDRGAAQVWRRGAEVDVAVGGRVVSITTPFGAHDDVHLALHGSHQGDNAMCALAAAEAFEGARLGDGIVTAAFADVRVPGRLEVLRTRPAVVVDGAHNPAGMSTLVDALREAFNVDGATRVVIGVLSNRDPEAMLSSIATLGDVTVYCCAPDSPRALGAEVIASAAHAAGLATRVHPRVEDATDAAIGDASEDDLVVITGSFYVVGAARGHLLGYPPHRG